MDKYYIKVFYKGETPVFFIDAISLESAKEQMDDMLPDCQIISIVRIKNEDELKALMKG